MMRKEDALENKLVKLSGQREGKVYVQADDREDYDEAKVEDVCDSEGEAKDEAQNTGPARLSASFFMFVFFGIRA